MNYNSVILVGILFLTTVWWFVHARRNYPGPALAKMYLEGEVVDLIREDGVSGPARAEKAG